MCRRQQLRSTGRPRPDRALRQAGLHRSAGDSAALGPLRVIPTTGCWFGPGRRYTSQERPALRHPPGQTCLPNRFQAAGGSVPRAGDGVPPMPAESFHRSAAISPRYSTSGVPEWARPDQKCVRPIPRTRRRHPTALIPPTQVNSHRRQRSESWSPLVSFSQPPTTTRKLEHCDADSHVMAGWRLS